MISAHLLPPPPLLPLLHRSLLVLLHHLPSLTSNNGINRNTASSSHLGVEDPLGVRIVLQRLLQIGFPKSEQVCKTLRHYVCCPPANAKLFSDTTSNNNQRWLSSMFINIQQYSTIFNNIQQYSTTFNNNEKASCHQCQRSFHLLMPATPRRAISPKTEPSPSVLFFVF